MAYVKIEKIDWCSFIVCSWCVAFTLGMTIFSLLAGISFLASVYSFLFGIIVYAVFDEVVNHECFKKTIRIKVKGK